MHSRIKKISGLEDRIAVLEESVYLLEESVSKLTLQAERKPRQKGKAYKPINYLEWRRVFESISRGSSYRATARILKLPYSTVRRYALLSKKEVDKLRKDAGLD
jgi:DNA invertase Pin-like site-specific DNA recombinase